MNNVGVVKSLATDGGEVITCCISTQCKRRFGLFTRSSIMMDSKFKIAHPAISSCIEKESGLF